MGVFRFVKRMFVQRSREWQMVFCLRVVRVVLFFPPTPRPYGLTVRPPIGAFLNGTMPETAPGISGNWSAVVAFHEPALSPTPSA